MAKNKERRPQLHSRAWFIEHLEKRLDELTDRNIAINDRLMDQYNVCAARNWPREDVRELGRLHGAAGEGGRVPRPRGTGAC